MYGPVRTVVWQGSAGDRRPYADLVGNREVGHKRAWRSIGDLLEADFWPGMTSGVPVIRPKLANTDDGDLEPLWL